MHRLQQRLATKRLAQGRWAPSAAELQWQGGVLRDLFGRTPHDHWCGVDHDWYGPEERETARRFQVLIRLLTEHLRDIQVFKIGKKIEYVVYMVGRTATGDFAGVSTKVVET